MAAPRTVISFDVMPEELKGRKQWCMWKLELNDKGKITKIPYNPANYKASSTDSDTWASFEEVKAAYLSEQNNFAGVGFFFNNDYTGNDFDHCLTEGSIQSDRLKVSDKLVMDCLNKLSSYTEISQSGTGLHTISKPGMSADMVRHKTGDFEMYSSGRFFVMTGNVPPGAPTTIRENQDALAEVYHAIFDKPDAAKNEAPKGNGSKFTDNQVIALAAQARNSAKFMALMDGKYEHFLKDDGKRLYFSQSEADLALCQLIAFYTRDPSQIDRIFRRSRLYREKWEREDYRPNTIRTAIERTTEHYGAPGACGKKPIELKDVADISYDKNGNIKEVRFSPTYAARVVLERMPLAMSDDAEEIYHFDGQIYKPNGARIIDVVLCGAAEDSNTAYQLKETLRRVKNKLLDNPVVFEPNAYLLGVKNGVADLLTGEVREYRREDLILEQLDINYDPSARCPAFLAFLESITPNVSDRITLIDWFAATAIKEPFAYVLFLLGLGRNGKGVYEKLIKKFFGKTTFRDMPLAEVAKNNFAAGGFYRKRG